MSDALSNNNPKTSTPVRKDKIIADLKQQLAAMTAERDELTYVAKKFGEWYSENGCPVTETKEGYCPDPEGYKADYEEEQLELDEDDRFAFDSSDCATQCNCGKCYVEYYKTQFRNLRKDGK